MSKTDQQSGKIVKLQDGAHKLRNEIGEFEAGINEFEARLAEIRNGIAQLEANEP